MINLTPVMVILRRILLCFLAPGIFALPFVALAQHSDPHAHHNKMAHQSKKSVSNQDNIILPDTELITQYGVHRRLNSEIIDGRIVVIDFVYTTCTTVCPVLSATLRQVQKKFEGRIDNEVLLVSISVDPIRDTPARLKAYADKLQIGEGWVWLTGDKQAVDGVLKKLGAYTPNFTDHPSMVLVGDASSGNWSRYLGFPSAEQIISRVEELTVERNMLSAAGSR